MQARDLRRIGRTDPAKAIDAGIPPVAVFKIGG
jgi:hypothetical protein